MNFIEMKMKKNFFQILILIIVLTIIVINFYIWIIKSFEEINYKKILIKDEKLNDKDSKLSKQEIKTTQSEKNEEIVFIDTTHTTTDRKKLEEEKVFEFYHKIASNERKIYSQNKEDGVIEMIFQLLNIKDLKKYFVEIGTENGKFFLYKKL